MKNHRLWLSVAGFFFVCGIVALVCVIQFWIIKSKNEWTSAWVRTDIHITNVQRSSATCCEVGLCECTEASPYVASCPTMVWNRTVGECHNGEECCSETCQYDDDNGQNTCECAIRVYHQKCQVACGSCDTFEISLSYVSSSGEIHHRLVRRCGLFENATCSSNIYWTFPNGSTTDGWYRRNTPEDYQLAKPTEKAWVMTAFMAIAFLVGIVYIFMTGLCLAHACSKWCEENY